MLVAGLEVEWEGVQMSTGNGEEQAAERESCPEPKAVPSGLPGEPSPPCNASRRDHPGTRSFAYSGLQALLLYLN